MVPRTAGILLLVLSLGCMTTVGGEDTFHAEWGGSRNASGACKDAIIEWQDDGQPHVQCSELTFSAAENDGVSKNFMAPIADLFSAIPLIGKAYLGGAP